MIGIKLPLSGSARGLVPSEQMAEYVAEKLRGEGFEVEIDVDYTVRVIGVAPDDASHDKDDGK